MIMRINSSRSSLARARMIRSASRKAKAKALGKKTSSSTRTNITNRISNSTDTTASRQLSLYEDVEKYAKALQTDVKNLAKYKETGSTADESKTTQDTTTQQKEMVSYIKEFVTDYNELYSSLGDIGGTTNIMFQKQLRTFTTASEADLKAVGITMDAKGKLSIDTKTLEAAGVDKLQKVFAQSDSYASKVSEKCENIESCAKTTLKVLDRMYGTQSTYSKYGTNSYYYGSSGSWYSTRG